MTSVGAVERHRERSRRWAAENPERIRERHRVRRARKTKAAGSFTEGEFRSLVDALGGACSYCGTTDDPLQPDHVVALANGGSNNIGNIVPACPRCNYKKWATPVSEWLRREGALGTIPNLVSHAEFKAKLTILRRGGSSGNDPKGGDNSGQERKQPGSPPAPAAGNRTVTKGRRRT